MIAELETPVVTGSIEGSCGGSGGMEASDVDGEHHCPLSILVENLVRQRAEGVLRIAPKVAKGWDWMPFVRLPFNIG